MNTSEILKKIDAIYARLPKLNCQRKCQESCGPIFMTKHEWQRIIKRLGYEPKSRNLLDSCPMIDLKSGACTVYHIRPMICRLWGIAKEMPCPWGCVPERVLSKLESYSLMEELESLEHETAKAALAGRGN